MATAVSSGRGNMIKQTGLIQIEQGRGQSMSSSTKKPTTDTDRKSPPSPSTASTYVSNASTSLTSTSTLTSNTTSWNVRDALSTLILAGHTSRLCLVLDKSVTSPDGFVQLLAPYKQAMEELVMKGKNPDIKITGPGIEQLYQNEEYADLVSEKISSRMWFDETNMAWIIEYMPSFAHEGLTQLFLGAYSNAALLNNNEELFRQGGCPFLPTSEGNKLCPDGSYYSNSQFRPLRYPTIVIETMISQDWEELEPKIKVYINDVAAFPMLRRVYVLAASSASSPPPGSLWRYSSLTIEYCDRPHYRTRNINQDLRMVQLCDLNLHTMFPPESFSLGLPEFRQHARQALEEVLEIGGFALPYSVVLGDSCPLNLTGQSILLDVVDMVFDMVELLRQESQAQL